MDSPQLCVRAIQVTRMRALLDVSDESGYLPEGRRQTMDDWKVLLLVFSSFVAVITVCVALTAAKSLKADAVRRRAVKRRLPDMGRPMQPLRSLGPNDRP